MTATLDTLFPGGGTVLLDGAMGTTLHQAGWPADESTVMANLDAPGLVAQAHAGFRDVGARVLLTNTFGALICGHRRVAEAVAAGVRIARKATAVPLAVSASKSGVWRMPPPIRVAGNLASAMLASQGSQLRDLLAVFLNEGVDLLVFETCNSLADAQCALDAVERLPPNLPAVLCATTTDGSRQDRKRVLDVLTFVAAQGAPRWTTGINCGHGPSEALRLALACGTPPRWLKPNNGLPRDPVDENVMAAFARAARQRGARFIGGCCGTTAESLTAMAAALEATT